MDLRKKKSLLTYSTLISQIVSRVGGGFTFPIISLQLQKFNLSSYNSYINTLPISNPYFARYYMTVMGCDLPGYLVYNRPCPAQQSPLTSSGSYKEDNFVLSTINAFYAIVEAQHRTVSEYCGSNYTKPCSNFLAAPDRRQTFLRNLNSVNFVDDGRKNFRFLSREGETAYDILQSSSSGSYSKVHCNYVTAFDIVLNKRIEKPQNEWSRNFSW